MRIALATAAHLPLGSEDDQVLLEAMRAADIDVASAIWDEQADWTQFDVVMLRSIWDYHLKYARFLQWLGQLEAAGTRVINDTNVVRWNADKHYMLDLERRGVRITPTRAVKSRDHSSLADIMRETGWQHAVIKPTVSSTGYETWFVGAPCSEHDESRFTLQRQHMDVLVQEFAEGVRDGEMSFVFLGGEYSHAVLKRAAGAEFRIHVEHGGTVETYTPRQEQVAWARDVMEKVHEPWTYARVDAVADAEGLLLMELELLDPELFFKYEPSAAQQLISAIVGVGARARQ
jgi:glutathione synthase/RimK-type ligase-like ATP-grasp enzyme